MVTSGRYRLDDHVVRHCLAAAASTGNVQGVVLTCAALPSQARPASVNELDGVESQDSHASGLVSDPSDQSAELGWADLGG